MALQLSWIRQLLPASSLTRGIVAALLAVLLTVVLELSSLTHVRKLLEQKGGPDLYRSAVWANIRNNLVLGPLTYHLSVAYVLPKDTTPTILRSIGSMVGMVSIEGILYYYIHKCFHEVKGLYWMHRYHHKFNNIVIPSAANAVSVAEYVFAYMVPLVVGAYLTGADEFSAVSGAAIIAITNLLIHTPGMEERTSRQYHWIFVSAADHLSHHRRNQKGNYGAPVFHMDRICEKCSK